MENQVVCDLEKCKGGCCELGDAGEPLEQNELAIITGLYEKIKPYLTQAAVAAIETKGKYLYHEEFGWVTPTLGSDKEICVYGVKDEKGIIQCAFEQAYNDGVTNWKKPVSCHLFPLLAHKTPNGKYDRLNYEPREKLCNPACILGKKLQIPAYVFMKEALIRKFGKEFYEALDQVAKQYPDVQEEPKDNK